MSCRASSIGARIQDSRRVVITLSAKATVAVWQATVSALVAAGAWRSEEHTSELQSQSNLVCRLLLEKKKATVSLAMPLAFEAPKPDLMQRSPRDPGALLLSRFVATRPLYVVTLTASIAIELFLLASP